jgi:hypothetical protein
MIIMQVCVRGCDRWIVRAQLRLLDQIAQERQALEKRGIQPDSTPIIRELRTRTGRRG